MRIPRKQETATVLTPVRNDTLQFNPTSPQQIVDDVPPIVQEVLSSSGQSLDTATRVFMEPRFGHDFSHVQVHTDERAVESAEAVNALAYTVGSNVVFGQGQYAPGTQEGKQLLAHELTHVVQQDSGAASSSSVLSRPTDTAELEAVHVSAAFSTMSPATPVSLTPVVVPTAIIQRQEASVAFTDQEADVVRGSRSGAKQTKHQLADAEDAILGKVKDYADAVAEGHRLGYVNFRKWYKDYRKVQEGEPDKGLMIVFEWVFKQGLEIIFPEEEFIRTLIEKGVETAEDLLKPEASDVNDFLDTLGASEEMAIAKLLDARKEFCETRSDALTSAEWELLYQREKGASESKEEDLPKSVKGILRAAGVGDPGSTTAIDYAERWLTAHINGTLLQNISTTQAASDENIRVMSEISALRIMDPENTQEQIYQLEQRLNPFFRSMANINEDGAAILELRLHIDSDQASGIVESRRTSGPFESADELVSRGIITRDVYEREVPKELSGPGQQIRFKHLVAVGQ